MRVLISFLLLCSPAVATTSLSCNGSNPDWQVAIDGEAATMTYRGQSIDFDIPHIATAEGDTGTQAYTLIGQTDTAILLVTKDGRAHVLTQDRRLPILLDGTCQ